jgi:hypothetical protein
MFYSRFLLAAATVAVVAAQEGKPVDDMVSYIVSAFQLLKLILVRFLRGVSTELSQQSMPLVQPPRPSTGRLCPKRFALSRLTPTTPVWGPRRRLLLFSKLWICARGHNVSR